MRSVLACTVRDDAFGEHSGDIQIQTSLFTLSISRDAPPTQSSVLELLLVWIGAMAGELGELVCATFLGRDCVRGLGKFRA